MISIFTALEKNAHCLLSKSPFSSFQRKLVFTLLLSTILAACSETNTSKQDELKDELKNNTTQNNHSSDVADPEAKPKDTQTTVAIDNKTSITPNQELDTELNQNEVSNNRDDTSPQALIELSLIHI